MARPREGAQRLGSWTWDLWERLRMAWWVARERISTLPMRLGDAWSRLRERVQGGRDEPRTKRRTDRESLQIHLHRARARWWAFQERSADLWEQVSSRWWHIREHTWEIWDWIRSKLGGH